MMRWSVIAVLTVLTFGCHPASADVMYKLTFEDINRVYDGDTIYVDIDDLPEFIGKDIGVRLKGIDTPERRSGCEDETIKAIEKNRAQQMRERLRQLLQQSEYFIVDQPELGSFSRIEAELYLANGASVVQRMAESRWAKPSDDSQHDWCKIIKQRQ